MLDIPVVEPADAIDTTQAVGELDPVVDKPVFVVVKPPLDIVVDDPVAEITAGVDEPLAEMVEIDLVAVGTLVDLVDLVLLPADVMELYPMDVVELGLIDEPEARVVDNLFGLVKLDEPAGVVDCAVKALAAVEVLVKPVGLVADVVALNNVVETLANSLELDIGVNKPEAVETKPCSIVVETAREKELVAGLAMVFLQGVLVVEGYGGKAVVESSYVACCVNVALSNGGPVGVSPVTKGSQRTGTSQTSQGLSRSRSLE